MNADNVQKPVDVIEDILKKVNKNTLLIFYKIPDFKTHLDFLKNVESVKKFKNTTSDNTNNVAKIVIKDFLSGNI